MIFMAQAAPCSLVPARVMSKGRIWSEYQGELPAQAGDGRDWSAAELVDSRVGATPSARTNEDWKIAFCERKAFSSVMNWGRRSRSL